MFTSCFMIFYIFVSSDKCVHLSALQMAVVLKLSMKLKIVNAALRLHSIYSAERQPVDKETEAIQ